MIQRREGEKKEYEMELSQGECFRWIKAYVA